MNTPDWRPVEGPLAVAFGPLEQIEKRRCSPDGPVHFAYVIVEQIPEVEETLEGTTWSLA